MYACFKGILRICILLLILLKRSSCFFLIAALDLHFFALFFFLQAKGNFSPLIGVV